MTNRLEIYKCNVCGNTVQVLLDGVGELVCCGEPMKKMEAHFEQDGEMAEKHTPVIEYKDGKTFITLCHHPMTEEHHIQLIEGITEDKSKVYIKFLKPNEKAELDINEVEENLYAIELCNIHGLWRSKND